MINSITVTNYLDEELVMDLRDPSESGIAVARIEGLGPPKALLSTNNFSNDDGGRVSNTKLEMRNIVLTLAPMDDPMVEPNRLKIYKYFPIKKKLKLIVSTDTRESEIFGYVESNEPEIFSSQQATQISIICPDPLFYSIYNVDTIFSGVEALFTFPMENPSLTEDLIEMSSLRQLTRRDIYYNGDQDVGVQIHIHATGPIKGLKIHNLTTNNTLEIIHDRLVRITGDGIQNGDDILITTSVGSKSVTLLREGFYYNILPCINRDAEWFRLHRGRNTFLYSVQEGGDNIDFLISNKVAYEGV